jgi:pectinesterase
VLGFAAFLHSADFRADIIVDQNGSGNFRTLAGAIDSLPMYPHRRTVILIKNGVYREKIRIGQNYITLRGESRDSTIIRYPQLRSDWNADKDGIGPAVVNIHGDDVVLENLTIENSQPEIGPHAFAVYGDGTRTVFVNCSLIGKGGDTVSLWNYKKGMTYHAGCRFEGAVDFVCPRGWCFIRDSRFFEVKESAALWHDGHYDPDQKLVVRNSTFDGVKGFQLGRRHYPAQFYLLDCRFSENMADRPIYRVTYPDSTRNNPDYGGDRLYYFHCVKDGLPYGWTADNLDQAEGRPEPEEVTAVWTFGGRWDPESVSPVRVSGFLIQGKSVIITFNEIVTVRGEPVFRNQKGKAFRIQRFRFDDINRLTFISDGEIGRDDLAGDLVLEQGDIVASVASVHERSLGPVFRATEKGEPSGK